MGGDFGPSVLVPAALAVARKNSDLNLHFFGDSKLINDQLGIYTLKNSNRITQSRITITQSENDIGMSDKPSKVLRAKQKSSMALALKSVSAQESHACISAGNTGALMGLSKFIINTLPGIDRPAIVAEVPSKNKNVYLLDLGANVDSDAESLLQYGVMGSVLCRATKNIKKPTLALLNIGSEDIKGNDRVRAAAQLFLAHDKLNYIGFIEGNEIFEGKADVVVCDGFVGNSVLKASEGIAKLLIDILKRESQRSFFSRIISMAALPVIKKLKKRINPDQFNGATLIGLRGIVVKSHGAGDITATEYAIYKAYIEAKQQVPDKISEHLESLLAP
jgi:phosphate acyltransferase